MDAPTAARWPDSPLWDTIDRPRPWVEPDPTEELQAIASDARPAVDGGGAGGGAGAAGGAGPGGGGQKASRPTDAAATAPITTLQMRRYGTVYVSRTAAPAAARSCETTTNLPAVDPSAADAPNGCPPLDPGPPVDPYDDGWADGSAEKSSRVTRHKARRRAPVWASFLVGLGAVVTVASGGAIVLIKVGLNQVDHAVTTENLLGNVVTRPVAASIRTSITGPINFLVVGVDTRPSGTTGSHADTIIMAHVPATHDRVYLVSIPRDTSTSIPADNATRFGGGSYKINAAFTFGSWHGGGEAGGFRLLAQTIKNAYGITFNGGAIVNFQGFTDILKKLGGVNMYVDETTVSIKFGTDSEGRPAKPYHIDPNTGVPVCADGRYTFDKNPLKCALPGVTPVVYPKGNQHLTPTQALDFVRSRDGLVGTDYARQRHQQQFIKALLTEAYHKGLSNPLKLSSFLSSIGKAFVFDGGGLSVEDWLFTLKGITPGSMVTIKTNDGQYVPYQGHAPDSRQSLNDTSLKLLDAVRDDRRGADTVGEFVATHPDWVAQS